MECADGDKVWYLEGEYYTEQEHLKELKKYKKKHEYDWFLDMLAGV